MGGDATLLATPSACRSIQPVATSADGGTGGGAQGAAGRGGSWGEFSLLGGAHIGDCALTSFAESKSAPCH